MNDIPSTTKDLWQEIEEWILPQQTHIQNALIIAVYQVYLDARMAVLTELLTEEIKTDGSIRTT